ADKGADHTFRRNFADAGTIVRHIEVTRFVYRNAGGRKKLRLASLTVGKTSLADTRNSGDRDCRNAGGRPVDALCDRALASRKQAKREDD
ncbi:MAG: hypothetical protein LBI31_07540, partial [Zoogloeaceae bacterium]|nr:hypothetical protein [Zoogloeaceae bacterium]